MQLLPNDVDHVLRHLFSQKTLKCMYYPPSVAPFSANFMPHLARFLPLRLDLESKYRLSRLLSRKLPPLMRR
jgi:hypothetical protein